MWYAACSRGRECAWSWLSRGVGDASSSGDRGPSGIPDGSLPASCDALASDGSSLCLMVAKGSLPLLMTWPRTFDFQREGENLEMSSLVTISQFNKTVLQHEQGCVSFGGGRGQSGRDGGGAAVSPAPTEAHLIQAHGMGGREFRHGAKQP